MGFSLFGWGKKKEVAQPAPVAAAQAAMPEAAPATDAQPMA